MCQCGTCAPCVDPTKDLRFCENGDFAGLKGDGGMAEYMIGDADNMALLPDSIDFVQGAPLMCAGVSYSLAIALHSLLTYLSGNSLGRNSSLQGKAWGANWNHWYRRPWYSRCSIRQSTWTSRRGY